MAGWDWLVHTNAGLLARVVAGAVILGTLAVLDYRKNGTRATRWREYAFLLAVTAVVLCYGVANDQVTSAISWEYYYYGKGLSEVLGDGVPPAVGRLHWEAAKVGLKATWSAGLIVGVAMLIANNPRAGRRQLSYRELGRRLPAMLLVTVATAVVFGVLGHAGVFTRFSEDFRQMVIHDEFRPRRFIAVFGIHLGGYVGGLLGTAVAVVSIIRRRGLNHEEHEEHEGREERGGSTKED